MLKNGVQMCIIFEHPILNFFFRNFLILGRFWEGPGPQKITKNSKKSNNNRFRDALGARLGFGYNFGSDLGAILEDFERIL